MLIDLEHVDIGRRSGNRRMERYSNYRQIRYAPKSPRTLQREERGEKCRGSTSQRRLMVRQGRESYLEEFLYQTCVHPARWWWISRGRQWIQRVLRDCHRNLWRVLSLIYSTRQQTRQQLIFAVTSYISKHTRGWARSWMNQWNRINQKEMPLEWLCKLLVYSLLAVCRCNSIFW